MRETDVAVIGGGIAGASAAWHLAGAGADVTVLERGTLAGETTARSAAFFGFYGSDVERRLKRYGMARYNEFLAAPRARPEYERVGRLRVATTAEGALPDGPGEFLDPSALHERVLLPELDTDPLADARWNPDVGYHRPRPLAREFADRARDRGATVETGAPVESIRTEDGCVTGVVADGERIEARAVVCAAGPWNPRVAGLAGLALPLAHSRAPALRLERPGGTHTLPIVSHAESGVYVRGDGTGGALVGHHPTEPPAGTFDPDEVPDTVPGDIRERMWDVLGEFLPALADARVTDEWVGVRSHTPDGYPIVGWTGIEGLSVAAFNSSGIQLSPAVGDVIARQLVDGDPTEHHDALSVSRFEGHEEARFSL
ncbi:MAG: NAD(P)/FAD-dependent oxidoreductase [Halobacteriales archaeon]